MAEADLLDGITHNLLDIHLDTAGDLTVHHHEVGAGACLARDVRLGVLGEVGVHDDVRYLRLRGQPALRRLQVGQSRGAQGHGQVQAISDAELIGIVRDNKRMRVTEAGIVAGLVGVSLVDGLNDLAATNGLCQRFEGNRLKEKSSLFFGSIFAVLRCGILKNWWCAGDA